MQHRWPAGLAVLLAACGSSGHSPDVPADLEVLCSPAAVAHAGSLGDFRIWLAMSPDRAATLALIPLDRPADEVHAALQARLGAAHVGSCPAMSALFGARPAGSGAASPALPIQSSLDYDVTHRSLLHQLATIYRAPDCAAFARGLTALADEQQAAFGAIQGWVTAHPEDRIAAMARLAGDRAANNQIALAAIQACSDFPEVKAALGRIPDDVE